MHLERWIERTEAIQSIPAPTFDEAERAEFMRTELEEAGVSELQFDAVGNLLAKLGPAGTRPLVISAHLDTVFPHSTPLTVRRSSRRLSGPGVGDNAVALAALVELAHDLRPRNLPREIWLVSNVCEEGLGNLRGMSEVVARFGSEAVAYIVLEGMALGHIYHRALPSRRYRIRARSPGGHSWIHAGRPSALHQLLRVGAELVSLPLSPAPKTTLNIGQLEGGRTVNTIADWAFMELDLRSESEPQLEALAEEVQAVVSAFAKDGVRLEVEPIGIRPAGGLPEDHPLVMAAAAALKSIRRKAVFAVGSTDASLPLQRGYPAVCVGLTTGGEAHSLKEYIDLGPMKSGYQSVLRLVETCAAEAE